MVCNRSSDTARKVWYATGLPTPDIGGKPGEPPWDVTKMRDYTEKLVAIITPDMRVIISTTCENAGATRVDAMQEHLRITRTARRPGF